MNITKYINKPAYEYRFFFNIVNLIFTYINIVILSKSFTIDTTFTIIPLLIFPGFSIIQWYIFSLKYNSSKNSLLLTFSLAIWYYIYCIIIINNISETSILYFNCFLMAIMTIILDWWWFYFIYYPYSKIQEIKMDNNNETVNNN